MENFAHSAEGLVPRSTGQPDDEEDTREPDGEVSSDVIEQFTEDDGSEQSPIDNRLKPNFVITSTENGHVLCEVCTAMLTRALAETPEFTGVEDWNWVADWVEGQHHQTLESFTRAVGMSCYFCLRWNPETSFSEEDSVQWAINVQNYPKFHFTVCMSMKSSDQFFFETKFGHAPKHLEASQAGNSKSQIVSSVLGIRTQTS
ncbi:hypothetical protein BT63DRAFT_237842 [Microthyrium microscopicum]|uniref:Uncharacterized protein n=1 Tax=Microthyrium microscopicum TaxID=703497 RepID=A0A6A6UFK9_9PEZI|nr:hypothetical protein BT63DRAFT_237842 [Microthyrium microscopicum]